MNYKTRIEFTDTMMDAIMKLVEGNPGAISVVTQMVQRNSNIDPDDAFSELGPLLALDSHAIYGSRIWMLYKDVCKHNLNHTLGLLRCVQMGILDEKKLQHAIDNRGDGLDLPSLFEQLHEKLPNFKIEDAEKLD